jgi:hypothetical protein
VHWLLVARRGTGRAGPLGGWRLRQKAFTNFSLAWGQRDLGVGDLEIDEREGEILLPGGSLPVTLPIEVRRIYSAIN